MTTMTTQIPTDALHTFALGLNRQRDAWLADATTELLGQLLAGEDMFTGDTWLITPAAMMAELHGRALKINADLNVVLTQLTDGALRHLAASGLSVRSIHNELLRRELGEFL